jgi:hypothetical protein
LEPIWPDPQIEIAQMSAERECLKGVKFALKERKPLKTAQKSKPDDLASQSIDIEVPSKMIASARGGGRDSQVINQTI